MFRFPRVFLAAAAFAATRTTAADVESCKASSPMRVAVLGATGGVGKHVVRLALEQGHDVIALARDPSTITAHEKLTKVRVDMQERDVEAVSASLKGADMVLSCLGNRRGEPPIVAGGTATLMSAMAKAGVPRMAMISSIGVGDSWLQLLRGGFGGVVFTIIFGTILKSTKADLNAAEALAIGAPPGILFGVAAQHARPKGVSAVVVRPAGLSDDLGSDGDYEIASSNGTVGMAVRRRDVARFMLTLVTDKTYDNSAVSVGGNAPRTGH